jgi:hypothetical protein
MMVRDQDLGFAERLATRLGRVPLVKTSANEEKWEMRGLSLS